MLKTTNYNLNKIELTDSPPDITVINPNWDSIDAEMKSLRELNNSLVADYIRSPGYGVTTGSANIYALTLNPALAAYTAGVCVAVKINVANTGASTININGLGAKPIKDSKGNALVSGKLALNSVYTFRYDGTNFILQGEGGEYGTATAIDVLLGKTIGTDSGLVTGTIPSKAATTITPSTIAQTIAAGQYLSGIQTILGDADLVSANIKAGVNIFGVAGKTEVVDTYTTKGAIESQILAGQEAWSNGAKRIGVMPYIGAVVKTPTTVGQTIEAGYHSGAGYVVGSANLTAANIKSGVNIFGVTGTFAGGTSVVSGADSLVPVNNTVRTTTSLSYVDVVDMVVNVTGTVKVNMTIGATNSSWFAYGKIYKNNIAVGVENRTANNATSFSEDIAVNSGDKISIYLKTENASSATRLTSFSITASGIYTVTFV